MTSAENTSFHCTSSTRYPTSPRWRGFALCRKKEPVQHNNNLKNKKRSWSCCAKCSIRFLFGVQLAAGVDSTELPPTGCIAADYQQIPRYRVSPARCPAMHNLVNLIG